MSSSSPSLRPDVSLTLTIPSPTPSTEALKPEERGIRLIQLLVTCVNHASSGNLHRADACLRQISQLASISGDPMQRLAAWFASALALRLVKRWPGLYKALNNTQPQPESELGQVGSIFSRAAFPCIQFSYAIIAQTLVRTMSHERVIHIVALGSSDPKLWVPVLQSFGSMPSGPPHLKITCVHRNKLILERLGLRLVKEAEALDMPFQFNPLHVSLIELTIDMLEVRSGEALALTSILNLHVLLAEDDRVDMHFGVNKSNNIKDCKLLGYFLAMVHSMSPKVFMLVEQEADHNMSRLVDRFLEGLHYYSAIFDSLDATFANVLREEERFALEEVFGREIENIVACEGLEREERHERYSRWMVRFARAGFKPVRLWHNSMEDVKRMVEASGSDGYKIANERASLMICWRERPLYAVSAWTC